jgi:hypothetical protein
MSRSLSTDHPLDTTQLEPGEVYLWAPAVHHGAGKRWHWVGYTHRLGLGVEPARDPSLPDPLVAVEVDPGFEWADVPTHTTPLVFPGVQSWTDLVSGAGAEAVRELETTMWERHGRGGT